jgi:glycosyltransferase involved in cell wall biosynthesis
MGGIGVRISIIVPVYNVKQYLEECIESLLRQDLDDFEIILVNDGSTDGSGALCNDYSTRYEFIKVIHKENGGLSDARNAGLRATTGEYVVFVDSDDYLAHHALKTIAKSINLSKPDVVFLEATKIFFDGRLVPMGDGYIKNAIDNRTKQEVLEHLSKLPKFPGSACTKMIKADLIKQHNLIFEKGLLSEDIDWTVRLLTAAETFAYCPIDYYYYRQGRASSITASVGSKNLQDLLFIIDKWANQDLGYRPFQREINAFMAYEYVIVLLIYASLDTITAKKKLEDIKKNRWLLHCGKSRKIKLINAVAGCLGIVATARILKWYKYRAF